jgi:hypothetical protein
MKEEKSNRNKERLKIIEKVLSKEKERKDSHFTIHDKLDYIKIKLESLRKLDNDFIRFGSGLQAFKGLSPVSTGFKKINEEYFEYNGEKIKYDPTDERQRWGHRYELNPCANENHIKQFEEKYIISLHREYREFLKCLGDGGAGPYYGLLSLKEIDRHIKKRSSLISKPFPLVDSMSSYDNKGNSSIKEMEIIEKLARSNYFDQGQIPIAHHGCGHYDILIVAGIEKGNVWHAEAGYNPISPLKSIKERIGFLKWYENWLDDEILAIKSMIEEFKILNQEYECTQLELGKIEVSINISEEKAFKLQINYQSYPYRPIVSFPPELMEYQRFYIPPFNRFRKNKKNRELLNMVQEIEEKLWKDKFL